MRVYGVFRRLFFLGRMRLSSFHASVHTKGGFFLWFLQVSRFHAGTRIKSATRFRMPLLPPACPMTETVVWHSAKTVHSANRYQIAICWNTVMPSAAVVGLPQGHKSPLPKKKASVIWKIGLRRDCLDEPWSSSNRQSMNAWKSIRELSRKSREKISRREELIWV